MIKHSYDWKTRREGNAFLALEDGSVLTGHSVGAPIDKEGEVVFNTGMAGYQEILSDPSYAGQFVTMTYPEIGNYGVNVEDMESRQLFLNGFIMHEHNEPSNWRQSESLSSFLKSNKVPAIAGLDTRALTTKIRTVGTLKGYLHCSPEKLSPEEGIAKARAWCGLDNQDYAVKVTCKEAYQWDLDGSKTKVWNMPELPKAELKIVAYDFGIKWNILRMLRLHGMEVTVVPAQTSAAEVLKLKPDGVFLSNGPADPAAVSYAIKASKELVGKVPVMGICLGHQILSLACGADRFRLKFGHHGCNHPVKNLETGAVEITSQNHNFAVDIKSIPSCLEVTHINLNDNTVEGVKHKKEPMFAVQYHPEAAPGPNDPKYLFEQFRKMMQR
ncbi:MAG: carbamoyl phosphate synthase small subunit [Lentisphaerae bacterium GWF2_52_8]|nr:MAG: carbamoyl phosphate synthase small subunit [Lentisphaerae bacterium GWF2_52_8]